jgi:hypothetical protein
MIVLRHPASPNANYFAFDQSFLKHPPEGLTSAHLGIPRNNVCLGLSCGSTVVELWFYPMIMF